MYLVYLKDCRLYSLKSILFVLSSAAHPLVQPLFTIGCAVGDNIPMSYNIPIVQFLQSCVLLGLCYRRLV